MLIRNIWPISKLYCLSDRVYQLQNELNIESNKNFILSEKLKAQSEQFQHLSSEFAAWQIENDKILNKLQMKIKENDEYIQKNDEYIQKNDKYVQKNEEFKKELHDDIWFTKFGYDCMLSDIQMNCVENLLPGNRRRLLELKDTHLGESCFIVGNGPSLKVSDLNKLKDKHIFCFGSKRINLIFNQTEWRPNIWGASDLDYIRANKDEIASLNGFTKLLCAQTIIREGICIEDAIYYPFIQMERNPPEFNSDVNRGVHFWGTITCKLINFAVYMGFKKIFLLGVDNTYPIKEVDSGRYEIDYAKDSHFTPDYFTKSEIENSKKNIIDLVHSMKYTEKSYKSVKWHCEQINVTVINATRGGKLEVFERMNFEKAINEI